MPQQQMTDLMPRAAPWRERLNLSGMAALRNETGAVAADTFLGVYDFSYAPYALGDSLTWQENILCRAIDRGYKKVRLCLVTDPVRPACSLQPHITPANYAQFISDLYPAFLSCPLAESVHVFRDRYAFNMFLFEGWRKGAGSWPDYQDHFRGDLDYISHKEINSFFGKHGYLPRLTAPTGYEAAIANLLRQNADRTYIVAINIRLSRLSRNPAAMDRDSALQPWHDLFAHAGKNHPDVLFLYLGGFGEWDARIPAHRNVIVTRNSGFNLGHELCALHRANLFMGTSSGFAAAATFGQKPYVITNMEPRFSSFNGVSVGAARYPFGLDHQVIHWERETSEFLIQSFETIYAATRDPR